jgi:hypothetical protein
MPARSLGHTESKPGSAAAAWVAWTPDGKSIIVNRQQRVSQIVLLENFWAP